MSSRRPADRPPPATGQGTAGRAVTPTSPPAPSARPAPPLDDDSLRQLIVEWLPSQRWFAGDAQRAAAMTITRRSEIPIDGAHRAELVLLQDNDDPTAPRYQLIVGRVVTVPEHLTHAVIGAGGGPQGATVIYDGLHDAAITSALLGAWSTGTVIGPYTPIDPDPPDNVDELTGLVLTSEQTNTSVVYGTQLIAKFFRRVEPGINPDAEIVRALRGSEVTPAFRGEWRIDVDGTATTAALATTFVSNSADAWSLATTSVRDLLAEEDLHPDEVGGDFAAEAHRLGGTIAHLHRELAERLPWDAMHSQPRHLDPARILADAKDAARSVPDLRALIAPMERVLAEAGADADSGAPGPWRPQRIHGDLHLGQVLRSVSGWLVIDFEGEPSRPIDMRRRPGSPLRDIAGMLRSFGYAARQPLYESTVNPQRRYRADEWMERNQQAFLDGYAEAYGADPREQRALLTMFELAKAVYEVRYELRHRPTWVEIPLAAIQALVTPG